MNLRELVNKTHEIMTEQEFTFYLEKASEFLDTLKTNTPKEKAQIKKEYLKRIEQYEKIDNSSRLDISQLGQLYAEILGMRYRYYTLLIPKKEQIKIKLFSQGDDYHESDFSIEDIKRIPFHEDLFGI